MGVNNKTLKRKYERLLEALKKLDFTDFHFLCNLCEDVCPSILKDLEKRLENMDKETYRTTIYCVEEIDDYEYFKKHNIASGLPFWNTYDKENRIKFLTKIIEELS